MDHEEKVGLGMKNDSLKREATFLYVKRQMREEMDLVWEDFFQKNPDKKEEGVWRRIEERVRSKQDSNDQNQEVCDLKETHEGATQCKADHLFSKGSMTTGEIVASVKSILLEKIRPLILKRRIWWKPVPEAGSYVVYVSKERTIFEPDHFSWETTPGIVSKLVIGKTELVIPDEWPEFPAESGTYYIGITSRDDIGNQSAPLLLSGLFKFLPPPAPLTGGIDYL